MAKAEIKYNAAKESTARQFERYINWWPVLFPEQLKIITDKATLIRNILPTLEELI